MTTELELLKYEKLAAYILIISYIIVIISAVKSEQLIIKEEKAENLPGPNHALLVAVAAAVETIGHSLLAVLATIRLKQRQDEIVQGESAVPIEPNLKITTGSWRNALSTFLTAVGTVQRAQQPQTPITIL